MSTPPSSSRLRTFNLPKSSPDAGLAEWTSKIKAIQQEVDRDEEVEHRKLQDEIARSRMERARRRNTATGFLDWSKNSMSPSSEASESTALIANGQHEQSDSLRKLTSLSRSPESLHGVLDSKSTTVPHGSNPQNISLAAFMGGRVTGPRLNKPAPQADSHDPTLYDQVRREGPHPIFGRTNKATIPGEHLASRGAPNISATESEKLQDLSGRHDADIGVRSNVAHSPQVARIPPDLPAKPVIYQKPLNQRVPSSDLTVEYRSSTAFGSVNPVVKRKPPPDANVDASPPSNVQTPPKSTKLAPSDTPQRMIPSSESSHTQLHIQPKPSSLAEVIGGRAAGPRLSKQQSREGVGESREVPTSSRQGQALPGLEGNRPSLPQQRSPLTSPSAAGSQPSLQAPANLGNPYLNSTSPKRSLGGSKIATPSLARPIQPQPVVQPSSIATASKTVSPAFVRPPPSTQDLHPSLSRLQGRGFVEKRVKASAEIYNGSNQQKARSTSAGTSGGRPTVLDRWRSGMISSTSPPTSPPVATSMNKDKSAEVAVASDPTSARQLIQPGSATLALGQSRHARHEETRQEVILPVKLPGMTYPVSPPTKPLVSDVDAENSTPDHSVRETHPRPLSHPTRDRARKPRKMHGSSRSVSHTESPQLKSPECQPPHEAAGTSENGLPADMSRSDGAEMTESETVVLVPSLETPQHSSKTEITLPDLDSLTSESNINRFNGELSHQTSTQLPAEMPTSDKVQYDDMSLASADERVLLEMVSVSPAPPSPPLLITPGSIPEQRPTSPSRHSRIPSTGQRATVMDVAQALQQHEQHIREFSLTPEPDEWETAEAHSPLERDAEPEDMPRTDVKAAIANWGHTASSGMQQTERRRSAYDRYSIATLPPLVEEKTPVPTPQGSLSRAFARAEESTSNVHDTYQSLEGYAAPKDSAAEVHVESITETMGNVSEIHAEIDVPPAIEDLHAQQEIELEHNDRPPPGFNLQSILKEALYSADPRAQTISVEIFSISGHMAAPITREPNVFYDSEVVAIVHRVKEKATGLVSTKVWAWRGKDAEFGEREEQKVSELAGRFGTKETHCVQGSEPHELIHVLGGVLATRQGRRVHWTVENTAMHRVHRMGDSIFVDQIDLAVHNLCSAYSYCLSVLDALYVWHGRGSSEDERKVASAYGQSLAADVMKFTEFEEGAEDEIFWMMLGDDYFANADHWKFKPYLDRSGARLYSIDCTSHKDPVQLIPNFSGRNLLNDQVFVVDCRLEIFVVVTPAARGKRVDIQLALFLAENISAAAANKRPFDPPVHILVLPSKLPLELQAAIRLCDEAGMNGGSVPTHMNLIPLSEALEHMQRRLWPKSTLSNVNFLPLGVEPRML